MGVAARLTKLTSSKLKTFGLTTGRVRDWLQRLQQKQGGPPQAYHHSRVDLKSAS